MVALDRFGDLDLQELCPSVSILRDLGGRGGMAELVDAAEGIPADGVVYGAGLENLPDLVARLAAGRTLLGCAPETLRRVRDPAVLGASLRAAGLAYPRTFSAREAPARADRGRRWLRKPLRGGGGRGVREWRGGRLAGRRHRPGAHRRAPVLGGGGRRRALRGAARRQRAARRAPGARRARLRVVRERRAAAAAGARAAWRWRTPRRRSARTWPPPSACAALFGVDVVWDGERAWVLEVNPRPTASLETIDAAYGVRSFAAHLEACAGRLPAARARGAGRGGREGGALRDRGPAGARTRAAGPARGIRDVPHPGEPIAAGHPICTLDRDRAARREAVLADLEARAAALRDELTGGVDVRRLSAPPPAAAAAWSATTSRPSSARTARLERLIRTCPLGDAWFAERVAPAPPLARVDGREAGLDGRSTRRRRSSREARAPLVYGLGQTSCEAQRAAVALAEAIGAVIDPAGPLLDGASGLAYQALGGSTATLGDVRDRAEVVVVWRADPAATHPRLFERLRLPGAGRELVVVDERRTATAEQADTFLELPRDRDVEALWTLRALVREAPVERVAAAEPPLDDLAARLTAAATGRSCTTCAGTSRRSRCTRSCATSAGSRTSSR